MTDTIVTDKFIIAHNKNLKLVTCSPEIANNSDLPLQMYNKFVPPQWTVLGHNNYWNGSDGWPLLWTVSHWDDTVVVILMMVALLHCTVWWCSAIVITMPDVTPLATITTKLFNLHYQPHMLNMLRTCNKLTIYSHSVIIVGDDGTHQTSMMVHVALPPAVWSHDLIQWITWSHYLPRHLTIMDELL